MWSDDHAVWLDDISLGWDLTDIGVTIGQYRGEFLATIEVYTEPGGVRPHYLGAYLSTSNARCAADYVARQSGGRIMWQNIDWHDPASGERQ